MEFIVLFLIVGTIVFILSSKHAKKVNSAWKEAASVLRLNYENSGGGSRMIRGKRVDLSLKVNPRKVGKSTFTEYKSEFREPLPFAFRLKPQSVFSDVANALLNRIDIETGDNAFDSKVIVEGQNVEALREFLGSEVRKAIHKLTLRFDSFEVTERYVLVQRNSVESNSMKLVDDVRLLEFCSRILYRTAYPQGEEEVEVKKSARVPPPLPTKSESPEEEEHPIEETPFEEVVESEEEVALELSCPEPLPKKETEIAPAPESATEQAAAAETIAPSDSAFAILCLDLFRECDGRYAFLQIFDRELKGREMGGSAVLSRAEPYSMDRIFGRGPGIRRSFVLGTLENGDELTLVTNSPVESDLSSIRSEQGKAVAFDGNLIACDAFAQTLFLRVTSESESTNLAATAQIPA